MITLAVLRTFTMPPVIDNNKMCETHVKFTQFTNISPTNKRLRITLC